MQESTLIMVSVMLYSTLIMVIVKRESILIMVAVRIGLDSNSSLIRGHDQQVVTFPSHRARVSKHIT